MNFSDRLALLISLLALVITAWISVGIFEGLAHLEDEFAYVWQAQAIAGGQLTVASPPESKSFLIPFVVDYKGQRFGKYPIGWPVVLSFGERLGLRWLVNPLLAGLGVWLTYRLGKKTLGETVGLLAAGLTVTSPFFLMNSGTLLSHPWGLVLSAGFAVSWLDAVDEQDSLSGWLPTLTAGLTLGVLAVSRPVTALGVAIPFGIHGLVLLARGPLNRRKGTTTLTTKGTKEHEGNLKNPFVLLSVLCGKSYSKYKQITEKIFNTPQGDGIRKRILAVGLIALLVGSLHFVWQYAVTGDPLLNPYTLWWEYDKIGFGPGYGVTQQGHNWALARHNTAFGFSAGYSDLFGWGKISGLFLPFGLWAVRRERKVWPLVGVFPVLVLLYMAYWVGAWLFGPRYYYEALYSLTLLTAAGIAWLAGWPTRLGETWRQYGGWRRARPLAVTALVALLVVGNLIFYTPERVGGMRGMFGMQRSNLESFLTPETQAMPPALVIVHTHNWREYAMLLELADPFLDTPFIFIWSRGPKSNAAIEAEFPDRAMYHYYPGE